MAGFGRRVSPARSEVGLGLGGRGLAGAAVEGSPLVCLGPLGAGKGPSEGDLGLRYALGALGQHLAAAPGEPGDEARRNAEHLGLALVVHRAELTPRRRVSSARRAAL